MMGIGHRTTQRSRVRFETSYIDGAKVPDKYVSYGITIEGKTTQYTTQSLFREITLRAVAMISWVPAY